MCREGAWFELTVEVTSVGKHTKLTARFYSFDFYIHIIESVIILKIVIYLYCYDAFLFKNASAFLLRDLCYTMHSILLHVTSYYLFRKSGRNPRSLNRRVLY